MEHAGAVRRRIAEAAALARIRELGGRTTMEEATGAATIWGLGDYDRFARRLVWEFGPELVAACGIGPGLRVLDVAAGTGNVALRAAEAGAEVVAADLEPDSLAAGRRQAEALGLRLEWVEADAAALPFGDGEFDVVTSSVGAMFAPDHRAVADELLRVCRPGGAIGMANYTPEGGVGEFFEVFARYGPAPPPGFLPPVLWGREEHVRELFGDRVEALELTRKEAVERYDGSPRDYCAFYEATFGPVVAALAALADEPERADALHRDFLDFATRRNLGAPDGPGEYRYGYLLVVARKRRSPGPAPAPSRTAADGGRA
ncbi:MAG TPA: methyltransferase domain-containing protein [Gaiellaceae bacterium]|nr:methyltransferase domain-containing protein [Gaiellaceae bacterium]